MPKPTKTTITPAVTRQMGIANPALDKRCSLGHPPALSPASSPTASEEHSFHGSPEAPSTPIPDAIEEPSTPVPTPTPEAIQEPSSTQEDAVTCTDLVVAQSTEIVPAQTTEVIIPENLFAQNSTPHSFGISIDALNFVSGAVEREYSAEEVLGYYKEHLKNSVEGELASEQRLRKAHDKVFADREEFERHAPFLHSYLVQVYWQKMNPPCPYTVFLKYDGKTDEPTVSIVAHEYYKYCRKLATTRICGVRNSIYLAKDETDRIRDMYRANRNIADKRRRAEAREMRERLRIAEEEANEFNRVQAARDGTCSSNATTTPTNPRSQRTRFLLQQEEEEEEESEEEIVDAGSPRNHDEGNESTDEDRTPNKSPPVPVNTTAARKRTRIEEPVRYSGGNPDRPNKQRRANSVGSILSTLPESDRSFYLDALRKIISDKKTKKDFEAFMKKHK